MEKKKAIFDKIYYEIGKQEFDFFVCGLWKKENGEVVATKWKKYSEAVFPIDFDGTCKEDWKKQKYFKQINQKQILPNELVLDIEEPEKFPKITKSLIKDEIPFTAYSTGSRGFHIHLLFKEKLTKEQKLFCIKKYGVDEQKAYSKTMIALEGCPHWKTGTPKKEISRQDLNLPLHKFLNKLGYSKPIAKREIEKEDNNEEIRHHLTKHAVEKKVWKK